MPDRAYLFVGGPRDGERFLVPLDRGQPPVRVYVLVERGLDVRPCGESPLERASLVGRVQVAYYRATLAAGHVVYVGVSGLTRVQVLEMLLAGYGPRCSAG